MKKNIKALLDQLETDIPGAGKILLQVLIEHELAHERGEMDEERQAKRDVKRIVELSLVNGINPTVLLRLLKEKGLISEEFSVRINWEGRTLVIDDPEDDSLCICYKFSNSETDGDNLIHEHAMMLKAKEIGIVDPPVPLKEVYLAQTEITGLPSEIPQQPHILEYSCSKDYRAYITGEFTDIDPAERKEKLQQFAQQNLQDWLTWYKAGYLHTSLTALTHGVQINRQWNWMVDPIGDISDIKGNMEYSNMRRSGLADYEHVVKIDENTFRYYQMGEAISEFIMALTYAGIKNGLLPDATDTEAMEELITSSIKFLLGGLGLPDMTGQMGTSIKDYLQSFMLDLPTNFLWSSTEGPMRQKSTLDSLVHVVRIIMGEVVKSEHLTTQNTQGSFYEGVEGLEKPMGAIADSANNIIVCTKKAVIKYSPEEVEIARIEGEEDIVAVATDSMNNIIVHFSTTVAKYSSEGTFLEYIGDRAQPQAIAVDSRDNILRLDYGTIVKYPYGGGDPIPIGEGGAYSFILDGDDNVIVRYSNKVVKYNSQGGSPIEMIGPGSPMDMTIDNDNNVIVRYLDTVVKYSPDGGEVTRMISGVSINSVATDSNNDIIVRYDEGFVKYSPTGEELFRKDTLDGLYSMQTDNVGNIVALYKYATIVYSSLGEEIARIEGPSHPLLISFDRQNNIIITYERAVLKYKGASAQGVTTTPASWSSDPAGNTEGLGQGVYVGGTKLDLENIEDVVTFNAPTTLEHVNYRAQIDSIFADPDYRDVLKAAFAAAVEEGYDTTKVLLLVEADNIIDSNKNAHLAGDCVSNGLVAVKKGIKAIVEELEGEIPGSGKILLQILIEHELRHEGTGETGDEAESRFMLADARRFAALCAEKGADAIAVANHLKDKGFVSEEFVNSVSSVVNNTDSMGTVTELDMLGRVKSVVDRNGNVLEEYTYDGNSEVIDRVKLLNIETGKYIELVRDAGLDTPNGFWYGIYGEGMEPQLGERPFISFAMSGGRCMIGNINMYTFRGEGLDTTVLNWVATHASRNSVSQIVTTSTTSYALLHVLRSVLGEPLAIMGGQPNPLPLDDNIYKRLGRLTVMADDGSEFWLSLEMGFVHASSNREWEDKSFKVDGDGNAYINNERVGKLVGFSTTVAVEGAPDAFRALKNPSGSIIQYRTGSGQYRRKVYTDGTHIDFVYEGGVIKAVTGSVPALMNGATDDEMTEIRALAIEALKKLDTPEADEALIIVISGNVNMGFEPYTVIDYDRDGRHRDDIEVRFAKYFDEGNPGYLSIFGNYQEFSAAVSVFLDENDRTNWLEKEGRDSVLQDLFDRHKGVLTLDPEGVARAKIEFFDDLMWIVELARSIQLSLSNEVYPALVQGGMQDLMRYKVGFTYDTSSDHALYFEGDILFVNLYVYNEGSRSQVISCLRYNILFHLIERYLNDNPDSLARLQNPYGTKIEDAYLKGIEFERGTLSVLRQRDADRVEGLLIKIVSEWTAYILSHGAIIRESGVKWWLKDARDRLLQLSSEDAVMEIAAAFAIAEVAEYQDKEGYLVELYNHLGAGDHWYFNTLKERFASYISAIELKNDFRFTPLFEQDFDNANPAASGEQFYYSMTGDAMMVWNEDRDEIDARRAQAEATHNFYYHVQNVPSVVNKAVDKFKSDNAWCRDVMEKTLALKGSSDPAMRAADILYEDAEYNHGRFDNVKLEGAEEKIPFMTDAEVVQEIERAFERYGHAAPLAFFFKYMPGGLCMFRIGPANEMGLIKYTLRGMIQKKVADDGRISYEIGFQGHDISEGSRDPIRFMQQHGWQSPENSDTPEYSSADLEAVMLTEITKACRFFIGGGLPEDTITNVLYRDKYGKTQSKGRRSLLSYAFTGINTAYLYPSPHTNPDYVPQNTITILGETLSLYSYLKVKETKGAEISAEEKAFLRTVEGSHIFVEILDLFPLENKEIYASLLGEMLYNAGSSAEAIRMIERLRSLNCPEACQILFDYAESLPLTGGGPFGAQFVYNNINLQLAFTLDLVDASEFEGQTIFVRGQGLFDKLAAGAYRNMQSVRFSGGCEVINGDNPLNIVSRQVFDFSVEQVGDSLVTVRARDGQPIVERLDVRDIQDGSDIQVVELGSDTYIVAQDDEGMVHIWNAAGDKIIKRLDAYNVIEGFEPAITSIVLGDIECLFFIGESQDIRLIALDSLQRLRFHLQELKNNPMTSTKDIDAVLDFLERVDSSTDQSLIAEIVGTLNILGDRATYINCGVRYVDGRVLDVVTDIVSFAKTTNILLGANFKFGFTLADNEIDTKLGYFLEGEKRRYNWAFCSSPEYYYKEYAGGTRVYYDKATLDLVKIVNETEGLTFEPQNPDMVNLEPAEAEALHMIMSKTPWGIEQSFVKGSATYTVRIIGFGIQVIKEDASGIVERRNYTSEHGYQAVASASWSIDERAQALGLNKGVYKDGSPVKIESIIEGAPGFMPLEIPEVGTTVTIEEAGEDSILNDSSFRAALAGALAEAESDGLTIDSRLVFAEADAIIDEEGDAHLAGDCSKNSVIFLSKNLKNAIGNLAPKQAIIFIQILIEHELRHERTGKGNEAEDDFLEIDAGRFVDLCESDGVNPQDMMAQLISNGLATAEFKLAVQAELERRTHPGLEIKVDPVTKRIDEYEGNMLKRSMDADGLVWEEYEYAGEGYLLSVSLYNPFLGRKVKATCIMGLNVSVTVEGMDGVIGNVFAGVEDGDTITISDVTIYDDGNKGNDIMKTVLRWLALKAHREGKDLKADPVVNPRMARIMSELLKWEQLELEKNGIPVEKLDETNLDKVILDGTYEIEEASNDVVLTVEDGKITRQDLPNGYKARIENGYIIITDNTSQPVDCWYVTGHSNWFGPVNAARIVADQAMENRVREAASETGVDPQNIPKEILDTARKFDNTRIEVTSYGLVNLYVYDEAGDLIKTYTYEPYIKGFENSEISFTDSTNHDSCYYWVKDNVDSGRWDNDYVLLNLDFHSDDTNGNANVDLGNWAGHTKEEGYVGEYWWIYTTTTLTDTQYADHKTNNLNSLWNTDKPVIVTIDLDYIISHYHGNPSYEYIDRQAKAIVDALIWKGYNIKGVNFTRSPHFIVERLEQYTLMRLKSEFERIFGKSNTGMRLRSITYGDIDYFSLDMDNMGDEVLYLGSFGRPVLRAGEGVDVTPRVTEDDIPLLKHALEEDNPSIKSLACEELGRIGTRRAAWALLDYIAVETDSALLKAASDTLHTMGLASRTALPLEEGIFEIPHVAMDRITLALDPAGRSGLREYTLGNGIVLHTAEASYSEKAEGMYHASNRTVFTEDWDGNSETFTGDTAAVLTGIASKGEVSIFLSRGSEEMTLEVFESLRQLFEIPEECVNAYTNMQMRQAYILDEMLAKLAVWENLWEEGLLSEGNKFKVTQLQRIGILGQRDLTFRHSSNIGSFESLRERIFNVHEMHAEPILGPISNDDAAEVLSFDETLERACNYMDGLYESHGIEYFRNSIGSSFYLLNPEGVPEVIKIFKALSNTAQRYEFFVKPYRLAKERLGGLVADMVPIRFTEDGRMEECSIEEAHGYIQKKMTDILARLHTLMSDGSPTAIAEAKSMLDKVVNVYRDILRRGVIDTDFGGFLSHFRINEAGNVFLTDISHLKDSFTAEADLTNEVYLSISNRLVKNLLSDMKLEYGASGEELYNYFFGGDGNDGLASRIDLEEVLPKDRTEANGRAQAMPDWHPQLVTMGPMSREEVLRGLFSIENRATTPGGKGWTWTHMWSREDASCCDVYRVEYRYNDGDSEPAYVKYIHIPLLTEMSDRVLGRFGKYFVNTTKISNFTYIDWSGQERTAPAVYVQDEIQPLLDSTVVETLAGPKRFPTGGLFVELDKTDKERAKAVIDDYITMLEDMFRCGICDEDATLINVGMLPDGTLRYFDHGFFIESFSDESIEGIRARNINCMRSMEISQEVIDHFIQRFDESINFNRVFNELWGKGEAQETPPSCDDILEGRTQAEVESGNQTDTDDIAEDYTTFTA
ncbi:MAG: hypothetical protein JW800_05945 [Candidatus Omnitrophica bacterium]|nr:hypothetical protein [Candidatus Omnitrophota bacterium]